MVWRIYLLTTNDEHLITLQGGSCGAECEFISPLNFHCMENPFELILNKLNTIENLLRIVKKDDNITVPIAEVFNLNQAAEYVSLSKSAIYKKTSERNIPHFKQGKKLFFKRSELDDWLTQNRISTHAEIEQMASEYIRRKPWKGKR
jgi:excisionase family DNA binding protein